MPIYEYEARDKEGHTVRQQVNISSVEALLDQLKHQGLVPIRIEKAKRTFNWKKFSKLEITPAAVKNKDLELFCRQMHTLLKAGITVAEAIYYVAGTTQSTSLARALEDISANLKKGQSIAYCFKQYSKIFPNIFVSLLKVGEQSGQLEEAFKRLSEYITLEMKTVKRIKSALRYPTIVIVAALGALIVINFFVVPKFTAMYKNFNAELPLLTRILMGFSDSLLANWPFFLIGLLIFFIGIKLILKTKRGRYWWDRGKLRIPVIGSLLKMVLLARFVRSLNLMLNSGVAVTDALNYSADILQNEYLAHYLAVMQDHLEKGERLSAVLQQSKLFSPLAMAMLRVGEESGSIEHMLQEIAEYYEEDADYIIARLGDMIEPFLLGFMGLVVLILALGVFLPIWNLTALAQK